MNQARVPPASIVGVACAIAFCSVLSAGGPLKIDLDLIHAIRRVLLGQLSDVNDVINLNRRLRLFVRLFCFGWIVKR